MEGNAFLLNKIWAMNDKNSIKLSFSPAQLTDKNTDN